MPVLTLANDDPVSSKRLRDPNALFVVCLCAAWCDSCREFRATYERLAVAAPDALFVWLDIEDDSDVCGEVDVEDFPTLAVFRGEGLLHFGPSLPHEASIARLIEVLRGRAEAAVGDGPVATLMSRLRERVA